MYLYGASGHAKVVIEILKSMQQSVDGLFDDNHLITSLSGYHVQQFSRDILKDEQMIITIGNNLVRKKIASRYEVRFGSALHPSAVISDSCNISEGSVVMGGVVVNADTTIGKHCIINTNASVDHDCLLADFVHISPNVALCGGVQVGEGTQIGAGSVVIPEVKIGRYCIIGAGSVILKDIPDNCLVIGNPGKVIKSSDEGND